MNDFFLKIWSFFNDFFFLGKLKGQIARDIAPNVFGAYKIARYLNMSVEYLLTGNESDEYKSKYENLKASVQNAINEN